MKQSRNAIVREKRKINVKYTEHHLHGQQEKPYKMLKYLNKTGEKPYN